MLVSMRRVDDADVDDRALRDLEASGFQMPAKTQLFINRLPIQ